MDFSKITIKASDGTSQEIEVKDATARATLAGYKALIDANTGNITTLTDTQTQHGDSISALQTSSSDHASRISAAESEISTNASDIASLQTAIKGVTGKDLTAVRVYTVGKPTTDSGSDFTTINAAITAAKNAGVSDSTPAVVLVYPGVYTEQIVSTDNTHGLSIVGLSRDACIIRYNGAYPDCVAHVDGAIEFYNLTLTQSNSSTYVVHYECGNVTHGGRLVFKDCRFVGGTYAIGCGLGQDSDFIVDSCSLDNGLYVHNSAYAGTTGQTFTCVNSAIGGATYAVTVDDAANSYGRSNSSTLIFSGNYYIGSAAHGAVLFRKNTSDSSQNKYYIPTTDSNIHLSRSSKGNSDLAGINYGQGMITINDYINIPANTTYGQAYYEVSIPVPNADAYDLDRYNRTLSSVTLPGVAAITGNCTVPAATSSSVTLRCTNTSAAAHTVSVSLVMELKN